MGETDWLDRMLVADVDAEARALEDSRACATEQHVDGVLVLVLVGAVSVARRGSSSRLGSPCGFWAVTTTL